MSNEDLPKGASPEQETSITETVVRWDLTPEDIAHMNEDELHRLVVEQQLMIGRLREAVEILRLANESGSRVSREDLEVIYSPEKHEEIERLRNRDTQ